jgi:hypothetical protein
MCFIDKSFIHLEFTSPVAFLGLKSEIYPFYILNGLLQPESHIQLTNICLVEMLFLSAS